MSFIVLVASVRSGVAMPRSDELKRISGNLRHLYKQMIAGEIRDQAQAARGLLGPAVVTLEIMTQEDASPPVVLMVILYCPYCSNRHRDKGEWATRPHHTHLCEVCGKTWRVEPYCAGNSE